MGLDMYLYAEKYVSAYSFSYDEEKELYSKPKSTLDAGEFVDPETPSVTVKFSVGYWRKANAIHNWFVNRVQGGEDDCGEYYVSREDLRLLKETCKQILEDNTKARELLPPKSGFFFGSTYIDECYFQDLAETVAIIDKLEKHLPESWNIKYRSSW